MPVADPVQAEGKSIYTHLNVYKNSIWGVDMGFFDLFEEATEYEGTGIGVWIPLNSSFIAAAKWTPDIVRSVLDLNISGTVDIQFKNGGGDSESCTLGEFIAFISAGSPGSYYNQNFKNG